MKVPVSWLKEYVDFEASPEMLVEKLTFSGIEVESVDKIGSHYAGFVVGEVLSVDSHPKADRLKICRVSDGSGTEHRVVCGAPNVAVGQKVPFARLGCELASGMVIKKAVIRGEASSGMLCAEDEVGLSNDHTGLMVLDPGVAVGTTLDKILGPPETVLDLEVTWNRPDCLSVIGVARELAALFGKKLKLPSVEFPERGPAVETQAKVTIEDPVGCPRYTGRVLSKVKLGPSPVWMQRRLQLSGVRPINNVVDITNYVMLECGQPLHAFDYTLLDNREIVVRRVRVAEKLATLDNIDRKVTPEMLVIADHSRPVALAGIMGGAGSEIMDSTETVLLESACFDPSIIRATSSSLNLSTESSFRFERGVDIGGADWASRRAAALMVEHAAATASRGVIDVFPGRPVERRITCRTKRVCDLLGIEVADSRISDILSSLEIPVVEKTQGSCTVSVPTFRGDITVEADLIEEVARINGLENIPAAEPGARVVSGADDTPTRAMAACRTVLVGLGITEIVNYSFLSERLLNIVTKDDVQTRAVLPNPVSTDYAIMRPSLTHQMLETLGRNLSRQVDEARLFEIGKTFRRENARIVEEDRLCLGFMGKVGRQGLDRRRAVEPEEMFLWLKGVVEQLIVAQHVRGVTFTPASNPMYEPGWCLEAQLDGKTIGSFGLVRKSIRAEWRMMEPVGIAEFSMVPLLRSTFAVPALKPVPIYPSVSRDVAIVVGSSVTHEKVTQIIWKSAPKELTRVELFDIFKSEVIGKDKKSMAYTLEYRSFEKTLTDEDANRYHEAIKVVLRNELKAEIRES